MAEKSPGNEPTSQAPTVSDCNEDSHLNSGQPGVVSVKDNHFGTNENKMDSLNDDSQFVCEKGQFLIGIYLCFLFQYMLL